ncbi:MAG TPA: hypothetical protein VFU76_02390 [Terriglobales bacterium]|nr:hypothetical protein [Terriglobales bacterium]
MAPGVQRRGTILCVVDRRRNPVARTLQHAGFTVIETFTTDLAVALCVSNQIDCVVLDQEFFVETDGWSVAQSLKMVRPSMCVLLVSRAARLNDKLPNAVDAIVSTRQPQDVVDTIRRLLDLGAEAKASDD